MKSAFWIAVSAKGYQPRRDQRRQILGGKIRWEFPTELRGENVRSDWDLGTGEQTGRGKRHMAMTIG